jgi:hypothetical protein
MMEPAWKFDALRLLERFEVLARAAAQETYPDTVAVIADPPHREPAEPSRLEALARPLSLSRSIALEKLLLPHHQRIGERRMAAVALAVRLYRADHGGEWPRTLGELVPTYLPSVPADPFDPRGGPLRYRPSAAAPGGGPVVYSVGRDGTDHGGQRPAAGFVWDTRDAVLPLAENPRVRPPEEPGYGESLDGPASE